MADFGINVQVNTREFAAQLTAMRGEVVDKAASRALNRTATTVRAEAARALKKEIPGLSIGNIKRQLSIVRSKPSTLVAIVAASVQARRKTLPLSFFKARQTRQGVVATVGRQRILVEHAFLMPPSASRSGVYLRTLPGAVGKNGYGVLFSDAPSAYRKSRKQGRAIKGLDLDLPISQVRGPGLPTILAQQAIRGALIAVARTRFATAYEQELNFARAKLLVK